MNKLKPQTLKNKTDLWFDLYQNNKWTRYYIPEETADPTDLAIPSGESRIITYQIEVINGLKPLEIIILGEVLHPNVQFINASGHYTMKSNSNGTEILWPIPRLDPKEREYFNVTVNVTGTDGFSTISLGAFAQGTDPKTMRIVSSGEDPLVIAPPELGEYLSPTIDAQSNNSEISELSAGMGDDPQAIFAYVRDKIEYDPYYGSMRGALGTYLGGSGSSEDQANLLVAMLRAAHIPARYVVGELDDETALEIINGMFKYPSVTCGSVPEKLRYDPAKDQELINTVKKHTWVEVYDFESDTWKPLDPTYPRARYGVLPYVPESTTGTYAELPDSLRYKMTILYEAKIGTYLELDGYDYTYPINYTTYVSQLTDQQITLSEYAIETGIFYFASDQFYPTLTVGNESINGSFAIDLLLTTSLDKRLVFNVTKPDGTYEEYEHPLLNNQPKYEMISTGGYQYVGVAMTQFDEIYVATYEHKDTEFVKNMPKFLSTASEQIERIRQNDTEAMFDTLGDTFHNMLKSYYTENDRYTDLLGDKIFVKAYTGSPRIAASGMDFSTENVSMYVNLVNNKLDTVAYPGQNPEITKDFLFLMGMTGTILEGGLLGNYGLSTPDVFVEAGNQSIPILTLENNADDLTKLNGLGFSDDAKVMMVNEIYAGKSVIVPEQPVNVNGENYVRWYVVDEDGNTVDWDENGMHQGAIGFIIGQYRAHKLAFITISTIVNVIYLILYRVWYKAAMFSVGAWVAYLLVGSAPWLLIPFLIMTIIRALGYLVEWTDPPTLKSNFYIDKNQVVLEKWLSEIVLYRFLISQEKEANKIEVNIQSNFMIKYETGEYFLFSTD
jgi:transglutaminase-like putative cysteine protease